jgi:hypothetical protein
MDRFDCQYLMATFVNVYIASFIRYSAFPPEPGWWIFKYGAILEFYIRLNFSEKYLKYECLWIPLVENPEIREATWMIKPSKHLIAVFSCSLAGALTQAN